MDTSDRVASSTSGSVAGAEYSEMNFLYNRGMMMMMQPELLHNGGLYQHMTSSLAAHSLDLSTTNMSSLMDACGSPPPAAAAASTLPDNFLLPNSYSNPVYTSQFAASTPVMPSWGL